MALLHVWKKISGWFSTKATVSRPPEWYLGRATECMERSHRILTSRSNALMLYRRQCQCLVAMLKSAIEESRKSYTRSVSPEHKAECLEALKLMYRVAKEVQSFIEDCCKEPVIKLMQFALTSRSVAVRVSSWGYHLRLCAEVVRNSNKLGAAWVTFTQLEGEGVECDQLCQWPLEQMASDDEGALMKLLESVRSERPGESEPDDLKRDKEVAGVLLGRLRTPVQATSAMRPGSPQMLNLDAWTVDWRQLRPSYVLGRGSSGNVLRGKWFGGMKVAVKDYGVCGPRGNDEIGMVMDFVVGLSHPNIVTFLGYSNLENSHRIVWELMDADLEFLMRKRMQEDSTLTAPFSIWVGCDIMLQVAEGVKHMHQNGIVHRDIKSRSILVRTSNDDDAHEHVYAKVNNFESSKRKERSRTYSEQTMDVGTRRWMAPELYRMFHGNGEPPSPSGNNVLKHPFKSDVYSFGMLCYEILTGEMPFEYERESLQQVREMVLAGHRPKLPRQCPQSLKNLIELCWDPEPSMRPSFTEICEELRHIRCCLLLEPHDHGNSKQVALSSPRPLNLPSKVSRFKGEYSCLKVKRRLGSGGSDDVNVYLSMWHCGGDYVDVAQKSFMGSHNQSFVNEVSIMASLKHRNVVRLLHYASDRRSCSIVMELMDEDLQGYLVHRRRLVGNETHVGPLSVDEVVHVILEVARGMEYVHGMDVVHRDLKSYNILVRKVSEGGQLEVKVADFGVSMKLESSRSTNLENSLCVGTIRWMAPEVLSLEQDRDGVELVEALRYDPFKSDVFSFGMVCYEILVGRVPFYGMENVDEVKRRILGGGRPMLPDWMPSNLRTLIEKCWQRNAYKRPSFVEIVKDLSQS